MVIQQTSPSTCVNTPKSLLFIVIHVFFLAKFSVDSTCANEDLVLARAVCAAAHAYSPHVVGSSEHQWHRIVRMLDNLQASMPSWKSKSEHDFSLLCEMQNGDNLAFFFPSNNLAIFITKRDTHTVFQVFGTELPDIEPWTQVCSYPASAVEVPNYMFDDANFRHKFADFLCHQRNRSASCGYAQSVTSLQDILRGDSQSVDIPFITKHIRHGTRDFRRTPLWLVIKIIIQMSLNRFPFGRECYKSFMLFFMCTLANDANISTLYSNLLHLMECKIQRRLTKLGSPTPNWLSQMAVSTLDRLKIRTFPPPFRNPSQDELKRDTQLSFTCSQDYICSALANRDCEPPRIDFHPRHRPRGTIHDFLSSDGFFKDSYDEDPRITAHDFEKAVEEGIDDWISHVVNVEKACGQLEIVMDKYTNSCSFGDPIVLLTVVELFIALDKLVVKELPTIADYSPELPVATLQDLALHSQTNLHRLSCAHQYLSARQSQSRVGWSVLSGEESLPVRYYNQSPHHQQLKSQIEIEQVTAGSQSLLPSSPLHAAKILVFELQCPACIRIWRSAIARVWKYIDPYSDDRLMTESKNNLCYASALRQYYVGNDGPPLVTELQFACFYSAGRENSLTLRYTVKCKHEFKIWRENMDPGYRWLRYSVNDTSHTPNDIFATLSDCPADLTLDESIAHGQLRSSGSLQWVNILHGLRSRTLNIRHKHIYVLLSFSVFCVGPLEQSTGKWTWHEELHNSSFCNALLDELDNLTLDVRAQVMDCVAMKTVSLLLTRLITSSPSEDVMQRTMVILRRVRRKFLDWIQEISYDFGKELTNTERGELLLDMSEACLRTFGVDTVALSKHFQSSDDISAALSCIIVSHSAGSFLSGSYFYGMSFYSRCLFSAFEALSNAILADAADLGIDLAVRTAFPSHKPGASKWASLRHPNARWLTCRTRECIDKPSQMVYLNLLDGELRIDGQSVTELYREVKSEWKCVELCPDQGLFVLPRMDPSNEGMIPKQKAHFFLRDNHLMVRVHCDDSKDILQWIPSKVLSHDLPPPLVDGHIHWLSLTREVIEIRPSRRPLTSSPENWRINCASGQFRAYKGGETLVDLRSSTWTVTSHCFRSLSVLWGTMTNTNGGLVYQSNNLLVTTFPIKSPRPMLRLSVSLPYFKLSFFANDQEELESRDFQGMVYDTNPNLGTLSGMEYLFVLQQKADLPKGLIPRRILVPNANPQIHHDDHGHVVRFESKPQGRSQYHVYDVDSELSCLIGNGDIESTAQLAYMHAATSRDKSDTFIGKTGVEAAISLLRSGGCLSIAEFRYLDGLLPLWHPEVNIICKNIQERYRWKRKYSQSETQILEELRPTLSPLLKHFSPLGLLPLFSKQPPPKLPPRTFLPRDTRMASPDNFRDLTELFRLLEANKSSSSLLQKYIAHLNTSALHARRESHVTYALGTREKRFNTLNQYYVQCSTSYVDALASLKGALFTRADLECPSITGDSLLRCLASSSGNELPGQWKKCLISFALLLLDLQRARRLLRFSLDGQEEDFSKELENEGCDGWDPEEYPDWLLIQIQGNFLIRRSQAKVAKEMISPTSRGNALFQMNMGEGKSSVIIPIVAAALADGKQLARVIVPKALTVQMFDILVARLGGLVNRPIYHLPFFRTPKYDEDGVVISPQMHDIRGLMSQCMAERGVLLMQPEHIVSLKLMCVEEQLRNGKPVSNPPSFKIQNRLYERVRETLMLTPPPVNGFIGNVLQQLYRQSADHLGQKATDPGCNNYVRDGHGHSDSTSFQKWMDSHIRDILDECDEILHSRFQLIYSVGFQQHIEGYPNRWTITQQVLQLVNGCSRALAMSYPDSFQIESGPPGSFPHIISRSGSDIGRRLKLMVIEYVMEGRIRNLDFHDLSRELRDAIRSFISDEDVLPSTAERVRDHAERCYSNQACMWTALLLLRGLLASDILFFALLQRRWRVDYGLNFRSMLAIPYRAKDTPAPDTQFGHPDITIILTCLSYYYSGLRRYQLRASFEILLDQDDPHAEYALWVKDDDDNVLPKSLRALGEINLRSSEQWDNIIFPLFSRNQAAIDLYLSVAVFPKEAKEYPFKLSASSWDLAAKREKVVTGFSGTDDGRWLLPMSIDQRDLDHQRGTSAKVLASLLHPENEFYITCTYENGERWTTARFLRMVTRQRPEIRVLLDVGAQILDSSNRHVAKTLLDIIRDAAGAVYFGKTDELVVLMRNGTSVPLLSSSLAQQLGQCVVYLDHAHTRGTDLKLPVGSRAAVTLGPGLTKDRLVQGCMRMRKLGRGHSIMFFAPPEVDLSIRALKKDPKSRVTTADVLCWTMHETWADIQQRAPYWAQQGMDHRSREDAWSRFCNKASTSKQLSNIWLQPAIKSLEDLYMPQEGSRQEPTRALSSLDPDIQQRCKDLGVMSLSRVQFEEQEREVNREREREWEAELPPKAKPAKHYLHPDVVHFVKTGVLPAMYSSEAFCPIFTALEKSSAATREADVWSPSILATTDFCNTIEPGSTKGTIDQYLRPVQWVVSSKRDRVLVLMSPFEVNLLIGDFRASEVVHLHVYAPRRSLRMKPSDDLTLYTIPSLPSDWTPPWDLIDQLNVFAGQLYFRDYESYLWLCRFLGVPTDESPNATSERRNLAEFLFGKDERKESKFLRSPLPFVLALLAIRNRGKPFGHTHMGKILYGQLLRPKDFEGTPWVVVPRRSNIKCETETSVSGTSQSVPPSPMKVDSPVNLGPPTSHSSDKRKLEMVETSSEDSAEKRPRFH